MYNSTKNHKLTPISKVLRKNITVPIQMNFSITKINCKSCGASFDATKQRTCPNCDSKYEMVDDDWVIMQITKK